MMAEADERRSLMLGPKQGQQAYQPRTVTVNSRITFDQETLDTGTVKKEEIWTLINSAALVAFILFSTGILVIVMVLLDMNYLHCCWTESHDKVSRDMTATR